MANVNGFDPAAFSIDGARHRASLQRVLPYLDGGGAEGIAAPGDCRVHQLSTAGTQVVVDPGALIILNRSSNARNQAYIAMAPVESRLDVDPSGTARSDLVIVRIEDPQYTGTSRAADYQYVRPEIIKGVAAGTTSFASLGLGYSAYALARIDLPANTTNITDQMIKPLRNLINPRSLTRTLGGTTPAAKVYNAGEKEAGDPFNMIALTNILPTVQVPHWATNVDLFGTADGIKTNHGYNNGAKLVKIGSLYGPHTNFDGPDQAPGEWNTTTLTAALVNYAVPANMRGTNQQISLRVRLDIGQLEVVTWSSIIFNVAFYEQVT